MPDAPGPVPVLVLLGERRGDNAQLVALADALGVPWRSVQLRFNRAAKWPAALTRSLRFSWRAESPLVEPRLRLVLSAGRKSVAAARWLRRRSGGRTRLVVLNRPWAPLDWFDLVVTTPQYALATRENLQANLLPFIPASPPSGVALPDSLAAVATTLPRPWTLVMVGGPSRPYVFDDLAARRLSALVDRRLAATGGGAWVLASPRTPPRAMDAIASTLRGPSHLVRWSDPEKPYAALRTLCDRFIVTADSASMLAESLMTGKPVTPFALEARPDIRWRIAARWREAAERAPDSFVADSYAFAEGGGFVTSTRDIARFQRALQAAGAFDEGSDFLARVEAERVRTVERVRALL